MPDRDAPMRRLLAALPGPVRRGYVWLSAPGRVWVRAPLAVLLMCGGVLGFLPVLGFWMVPVGAVLLSQDVPILRGPTMRGLGAVQRWWDQAREWWARRR